MALHVRFYYGTLGASLGYSIERLVDGLTYDFGDGTFKASPVTLISALTAGSGSTAYEYYTTLTPTPQAQFTDGDYAVRIHDTASANKMVGLTGATMYLGDDATIIGASASVTQTTTFVPVDYSAFFGSSLTDLYCTDEHIAVRMQSDIPGLLSKCQLLGTGTDGVFLSGNRWQLSSATNDFVAQSVPTSSLVVLASRASASSAQGINDVLAVSSVSSSGLLLRRIGLALGQGFPPGAAGGSTAISFNCFTALPQISEATRYLNQRLRIPQTNTLQHSDDLRRACVLLASIDILADRDRSGEKNDGNYAKKLSGMKDELKELMCILDRTYGLIPAKNRTSAPATNVYADGMTINTRWF